jgi:hypothetical protein
LTAARIAIVWPTLAVQRKRQIEWKQAIKGARYFNRCIKDKKSIRQLISLAVITPSTKYKFYYYYYYCIQCCITSTGHTPMTELLIRTYLCQDIRHYYFRYWHYPFKLTRVSRQHDAIIGSRLSHLLPLNLKILNKFWDHVLRPPVDLLKRALQKNK